MTEKVCTECFEKIHIAAKKCPHCRTYQNPISKFFHSHTGQWAMTILFIIALFYWFDSDYFSEDIIYDTSNVLEISNSTFSFQESDCGFEVVIIGTIKNKSDDVLSYISVDAEFFDSNNSPIDVFNEEMWDLSVSPNTERRFKITRSIASNKDIYVSHKITINQAERNAWL